MKKSFKALMFFLLIFCFASSTIFAYNTYLTPDTNSVDFDLYVDTRDEEATGYIQPTENIEFVVVEVITFNGQGEYNAVLKTYYAGSWITIGRIDDLDSSQDLSFNPINGVIGGQFIDEYDECSGSNTSQYNCMISSEKYKIYFENDNFFRDFDIHGVFYGWE